MENKKILHIVRHGKSSWDYSNIADIDRPLKLRGIENGYEMARRLKLRFVAPDILLSSPAVRALHTATIFTRVLQLQFEQLKILPGIYMGGEKKIHEIVTQLEDHIQSVMIFGHNPDFTYLANEFTQEYISNIPTTGIVSLTFNTNSWTKISKENLDSEYFDYPKKKA